MRIIVCGLFTLALVIPVFSQSQTAPLTVVQMPAPPATKLEALEQTVGAVIVRARQLVGNAQGQNGDSVVVECDVYTDARTGAKEYGADVRVLAAGSREPGPVCYVDYDEMAPLIKAVDFISRITGEHADLVDVGAVYHTRSGLEVEAFSELSGRTRAAVETAESRNARAVFDPPNLAIVGRLLEAAKAKLDSIRGG